MTTEGQQLNRLTRVLEEREAPIERVLSVVTASGSSTLFLGVSALTRRLELLVPIRPEAVEAAAPGRAPGPLPDHGMLSVSVDGPDLTAAILAIGTLPAAAAVDDVAPPAARDRWLAIVEPMLGFAGGVIMNRTRFFTEARAGISVAYPRREGAVDEQFVRGIDAHAARLGMAEPQRALWQKLYAAFGSIEPLSVSTECTPAGPTAQLAVRHGQTEWDRAIDVIKVMVDPVPAREAAAVLGMLAGTLEVERPRGLEIVLGPGAFSDALVWIAPRRTS